MVTWLQNHALDAFLVVRAALVQRARELLPPVVSRSTIDRLGKRSLRPFMVGLLQRSADDTEVYEAFVLMWRWRDRSASGGAAAAPRLCVCGFEWTRSGMVSLAPDDIRSAVHDSALKTALEGIGESVDIDLAEPAGLRPLHPRGAAPPAAATSEDEVADSDPGIAQRGSELPAATTTVPQWPAVLFEDDIARAFAEADAALDDTGVGLAAQHLFAAAAGTAPVERFINIVSDAERSALLTYFQSRAPAMEMVDSQAQLFSEPLSFYTGYRLLSFRTARSRRPTDWLVCSTALDVDAPLLKLGGDVKPDTFSRTLKSRGQLSLSAGNAAEYARFISRFNGLTPVETPADVPTWTARYGDTVGAALAPRVRPFTRISDGNTVSIVAGFTHRDPILALNFWTIDVDGGVTHHSSPLMLDPAHSYPPRAAWRVQSICAWNIAAALHASEFREALAAVGGAPTCNVADLWDQMRAPAPDAEHRRAQQPVSPDEYRRIRQQLDDHLAGISLPEEPGMHDVQVTKQALPFYNGYALYGVSVHERDMRFVGRDDVSPPEPSPLASLDGSAQPIHWLNATLLKRNELEITADYATDYLRFFGTYVHAEQGAFSIVEDIADFEWRFWTDAVQQALAPVVRRVVLLVRQPASSFALLAFVNYGRDLWLSLFTVTRQGVVDMKYDRLVLADLPVHPHRHDPERDAAFVVQR